MSNRIAWVTVAFVATFLILPLASSATAADDGFQLKDTAGQHLDVLHNGTLVGRYMYALDLSSSERRHDTYKPFLHVFDPQGSAPITKGPGGRYTHHRGIFRGWSRLSLNNKSYDTWHMRGVVQKHLEFTEQQADQDGASFGSQIRFQTDDGEVLLEEQRTMAFLPPPKPAYAVIDVTSTVKAVAGAIRLHGDPEHAGLQFRPANDVIGAQTQYLFPGKDTDPRRDRDLTWVAESFVINGDQRFTVVYMNHPENSDGAIFSAYRSYGRFGAWFNGEVSAEGEKTTRVRFVILDSDLPSADFIQQQYNAYAGTDAPTPEVTRRAAK
jgi:hypothetical protein